MNTIEWKRCYMNSLERFVAETFVFFDFFNINIDIVKIEDSSICVTIREDLFSEKFYWIHSGLEWML